jgi:ribonuclease Z
MYFLFLGTAGAIPSAVRDTTWLAVVAPEGTVLVDCGGSPVARLRQAGLDPLDVTHVVITHLHADHAYGLPALVQGLRLLGRQRPLWVWSRVEHLDPLRQVLAAFGLDERPGTFPVRFGALDLTGTAVTFAVGALQVRAAPNEHGRMPNVALRVDVAGHPDRAVVYSSDTAPCDAVVALARGAHTLIHEATFPHRDRGRFGVHSTAREAGEVAARAGVRRLLLVHIDSDYHEELDALAAEAAKAFGGPVEVARERVRYPL